MRMSRRTHEMAHIVQIGDMVTLTLIQFRDEYLLCLPSTLLARAISGYLARDNETVSALTLLTDLYRTSSGSRVSRRLCRHVRLWSCENIGLTSAAYCSKIKNDSELKNSSRQSPKASEHDTKMTAFMITEPDSFLLPRIHPSTIA